LKNNILIILICFIPTFSSAETVNLTSGKIIEGTIIDRTNDYIKIDAGIGIEMTYYLDEIESIDGKSLMQNRPLVPAKKVEVIDNNSEDSVPQGVYQNDVFKKEPRLAAEFPVEVVSVEKKQAMLEYVNETFGIKFSYPSNWQVFDRDIRSDVFYSLVGTGQPAGDVCVLSPAKDLNNLFPLLIIIREPLSKEARGLPVSFFAEREIKNMQQLPHNTEILEFPTVMKIGDKEVLHYLIGQIEEDVSSGEYQIFNRTAMYSFGLITTFDERKIYKRAVEDIISTLEFIDIEFSNQDAGGQTSNLNPRHREQNVGGLMWALLAILGGMYVWKNPKANNIFAMICFLYAAWQIISFILFSSFKG